MSLRLPIKFFLLVMASLVFAALHAQQNEQDLIESPYRSEYNPWFKFNVFVRGFNNTTLKATLDSLEAKPRQNWNHKDSLRFASASMNTGNVELAAHYFHRLHVNYVTEEQFWWDHIIVHFLNREYNTCISAITKAEPGVVEHTRMYFFEKICEAKLRSLRDEKWYKKESVLSWEVDSTIMLLDKDGPEFHEKVIVPLENLRFVLEMLIRHIHDDDEVIARTCLEMGRILDAYISPTQAFIAMSLGRHYSRWDKEITESLKVVKAQLIEKKYRIPIFRKYFPRIEYWRFDYQVLKEKIIYERSDTVVKTKPVLRKEKKQEELSFSPELVILAGLGVMFITLLLFLKTKKK